MTPDPRLSLEGRSLRMVRTGTQVSVGPRLGEGDYETVVAVVEPHPASPGQVVLRNAGAQSWTMRPDGETAKMVEPGRRLAVRAMTIDFRSARGGF